MGRRSRRTSTETAAIDRFALDLPKNGQWGLLIVLRQRGIDLFDAEGKVAFNTP